MRESADAKSNEAELILARAGYFSPVQVRRDLANPRHNDPKRAAKPYAHVDYTKPASRITDADKLRMVELHEQGMTAHKIGLAINRDRKSVILHLRKMGIKV